MILRLGRDQGAPVCPAPIADAVEMWARKSGRHARMLWVAPISCWSINLTLRPDAPAMKLYREGKVSEEPTEGVLLHDWDVKEQRWVPIDLEQHGPTAVVERLEMGDTWSGRGRFNSLQEGVDWAARQKEEEQERTRQRLREQAEYRAVDVRRQIEGIPLVGVGIDLKQSAA